MVFAPLGPIPRTQASQAKPSQANRVWHSGLCRACEARFLDAIAAKSVSPRVIFRRAIVTEVAVRKLNLSHGILLLLQASRKFTFNVCFFFFLVDYEVTQYCNEIMATIVPQFIRTTVSIYGPVVTDS